MEKLLLGNVLPASPIALGCMRMAGMDDAAAEQVVFTALENGIDFFDHADIYGGGESEEIFGRVLKNNPGLREKIVLQSKCGICKGYYDASKEHILEAADGILKRLGVDYLDALLLHRPDALMEPEEVAEAFETLHRTGKVRYFGVSNQNAAQMELLGAYMQQKLIINQLQFSIAHTGLVDAGVNVNIHSDHAVVRDGGVLDYCRLNDITIQAWSPFQYGMFKGVFLGNNELYPELNAEIQKIAEEKGVTDSAIAVAWIMCHPAKIQTIIGSMNAKRIADIAKAQDITLTRQEWYRLYLAAGNPLP
ncbi:MAG: aldo/keto reductase [Clostridia bacterium]|nr:aldo/keto reductase [Clostridia bacterium]